MLLTIVQVLYLLEVFGEKVDVKPRMEDTVRQIGSRATNRAKESSVK